MFWEAASPFIFPDALEALNAINLQKIYLSYCLVSCKIKYQIKSKNM